jgi:N-acetylglucosamine transport system substrate-binding protein
MKKLGNFQSGCIGMSHTESQMEFLVGRAAMIPCGTWLHSEMRELLPPDFEMEFMLCPHFADGKGDASLVAAGPDSKGWCIPAKAKHPDVAADFFRYMTAPSVVKRFVEEKGTLVAFRDLGEINAPEHLLKPLECVTRASRTWQADAHLWYPSFATEVINATRDLYNEMITPEEFVDLLEKAATRIREDPHIEKFRVE